MTAEMPRRSIDLTLIAKCSALPPVSASMINGFFVTSNILADSSGTILSDGTHQPTVAHIPISVAYGCFQNYKTYSAELETIVYPHIKNISNFDIQLRDEFGQILDSQGIDFYIEFKIYY